MCGTNENELSADNSLNYQIKNIYFRTIVYELHPICWLGEFVEISSCRFVDPFFTPCTNPLGMAGCKSIIHGQCLHHSKKLIIIFPLIHSF